MAGAGSKRVLLIVVLIALAGASGCVTPPPPPVVGNHLRYDLDQDGKADLLYARDGWRRAITDEVLLSVADPWGGYGSGDFDGDGVWELAVITGTGDWVTSGARGNVSFPGPSDLETGYRYLGRVAVPADYDGDGRTELAWYREADATWWIEGRDPEQFGNVPGPYGPGSTAPIHDVPVPADYDGDGRDDLATWSPTSHTFHIQGQADIDVGEVADLPLPADYSGSGYATPGSFNTETGMWHVAGQSDRNLPIVDDYIYPYIPAPADYDGLPGAELSVYLGGAGTWQFEDGSVIPIGGENPLPAPMASHPGVFSWLRMVFLKRCLVLHEFTC